jgi:hypothetical protein
LIDDEEMLKTKAAEQDIRTHSRCGLSHVGFPHVRIRCVALDQSGR